MPTAEERLASLEARVDAMSDVRNLITELRGDMNARFIDINGRITELRDDMNRRLGGMNGRFSDMDRQFSDLRGEMNYRFVAMDQKADRHFTWMVSTQVALLLAVFSALVSAYYR